MTVPVAMVACGGDHSLLVTSCGAVWAFGRNSDGQLGTGGDRDASRPALMVVPAAYQAACGADHSLVLATDGKVWASGRGAEGQLGTVLPDGINRTLTPLCVGSLPRIHLVACGADHSVVVDCAGHAFGFGENSKGQLGLGHCINQHHPAEMPLPDGFLAVSADCGGTHTLVLADDSLVFGCGGNDQGQLGLGLALDRHVLSPVVLHAGAACRARSTSCGFSCSVLLTPSASVWVLGGRSPRADIGEAPAPWRVRGPFDRLRVSDVAAGGGHALCLAGDALFSLGLGQLGHHSEDVVRPPSPTPRRVFV